MTTWAMDPRVTFVRPEHDPTLRPDEVGYVVKGTAADGRRFFCEGIVTRAMLDDLGEEKVAELLRADARPPAES